MSPDTRSVTAPSIDVSVIIPVYNAAPWLDECLSTVLAQSDVMIEVICINDESTDDSRDILARFAQHDPRVRIIDQPNSGQSVGRNVGMDAARGRYSIFLDSDDYWAMDALSDFVRRADADRLDMLLLDGHAFRDENVSDEVWERYKSYYQRTHEYDEPRPGVDMIVAMRKGRDYRVHVGMYLTRMDYARSIEAKFIPGIVHQDNPYTFMLLLNAGRVAHTKTNMYARRLRAGSTITTMKAVNSARGYYLSYAFMIRQLSNRDLPPAIADELAALVHNVFASARTQFLELPVSVGNELKDLDPSPAGQLVFRLLKTVRDDVRRAEDDARASMTVVNG